MLWRKGDLPLHYRMKKNKPLKNKRVWTCGCCWKTDNRENKTIELKNLVFQGDHIQSAVLYLKEQLLEKGYCKPGDDLLWEINKAFPDVTEDRKTL